MNTSVDNETVTIGTILILIGILCFTHNEQIAKYVAQNYTEPLRWLFGDKAWVQNEHKFALNWARKYLRILALIYFGGVGFLFWRIFL